MYRLNQIKLKIGHSENDFRNKIAKIIGVSVRDINWGTLILLHKSIDARDKNNILFVYNIAFDFTCEDSDGDNKEFLHNKVKEQHFEKIVKAKKKLEKYEMIIFDPVVRGSHNSFIRPLVVGFGPAGIFASYVLALNGLRPIIVERGKSLDERVKDVNKFFDTMELDENSNVCFGEGGAGAFSDGKLNTNNKDKTGMYRFVLQTFVKFGADEKILYENLPHIGTDKLIFVIKNIRDEIIRLGGEIYYNTKFSIDKGLSRLTHTSEKAEKLNVMITKETPIILAIGNSSRDTFRNLYENGFDLKAKAIAVGYRIAHRQSMINEVQYGKNAKDFSDEGKVLGPATYKLTFDVGNGHSVYSFCMCPGGYIINSSNFKGLLSINGMSYNDRSGKYANSAIVETITPEDIRNSCNTLEREISPLDMIEFQEKIEKEAFELEKGFIPYIKEGEGSIDSKEIFKGGAKCSIKLKSVFENSGLKININEDIEKALIHFNKIIPGFYANYIIAGVETRTSSPVRLERDENYVCNIKGFYPSGEGLGHGGGIMTSAVDGIKVAIRIVEKLTTIYSG